MNLASCIGFNALVMASLAGGAACAADAPMNPTTLKRAADLFRADPAIAKAEGALNGADLRVQEYTAQLKRYGEMLSEKAIPQERYDEVQRDLLVAAATLDEAKATLARARTDKQRLQAETLCDEGNCGPLQQAWADLRIEDIELARTAVAKMDPQIAFDKAEIDRYAALVAISGVDARFVEEYKLELASEVAARDGAQKAYEQLQLQPPNGL
jgi:hypothetical protein